MKKLISLCLTLVMILSLSVPTFASFTDSNTISEEYEEAAEILNGMNVIVGTETGAYLPKKSLTRAEACAIVTRLLGGEQIKGSASCNFTDVSKDAWYYSYVSYCYAMGIVVGYGNNVFGPQDELTGYQFAQMLLRATGWDASKEGIDTSNWKMSVCTLALRTGLLKDLSLITADGFNREKAAELAYLAMTNVSMASYIKIGDSYIHNDLKETMGERYYDLKCEVEYDEFGRPVTSYTGYETPLNHKRITYCEIAEDSVAKINSKLTASEVSDLLSGYTISDKDNKNEYKVNNTFKPTKDIETGLVVIYNNATTPEVDEKVVLKANVTLAKAISDITANGREVEFFADEDDNIYRIVVNSYAVGKVTNITETKDATKYYVDNSLLGIIDKDTSKNNTIVLMGNVSKGDVVTYTKTTDTYGDELVYVYETETVIGSVESYRTGGTIKIAGVSYEVADNENGVVKASAHETYRAMVGNDKKEFYLDKNGYLIGSNGIVNGQYTYIIDAYGEYKSNIYGDNYIVQVKALTENGDVDTFDVKVSKKNGVYTLTGIGTEITAITVSDVAHGLIGNVYDYGISGDTLTLNKKVSTTKTTSVILEGQTKNNGIYMNSKTVYVLYDGDTKTVRTVVGNKNLGNININNAVMVSDDGVATYVFSEDYDGIVKVSKDSLVYIDATEYSQELVNKEVKYSYEAIGVDEDIITVYSDTALIESGLYVYDVETNGVTDDNLKVKADGSIITEDIDAYFGKVVLKGSIVIIGEHYFNIVDETYIANVGDSSIEIDNCIVITDGEYDALYIFVIEADN